MRSLLWILTHPLRAGLAVLVALYIGAVLNREQRQQAAP